MSRALAVVLVAAVMSAAPVASAETIAITGATVYRRGADKVENATVVLRDGVVAEVGAGVAVPAGARTIDGRGKVVTAGLVDAASQLGLIEVELEGSANDGRFPTTPTTDVYAAFRATDAYNPLSIAIPIARTGGVTSAITGPSGGLVAGQAAWASLAAGTPAPIGPVAVNAGLGAASVALRSRGTSVERLRELLDDADSYRRNRAAFDRNQSRRLSAGRLDLEALLPVLDRRLPLAIRASSAVEIRAALALAAERRIRIAIIGGAEAWRLARELATAKVAVVLDPTQNLPDHFGALDVRDDAATLLARAGVVIALSPLGDVSAVRTLRQLAGIAVANGLPWAQALDAITAAPAAIYAPIASARGTLARGTLMRGAAADVVVWTGDPLELSTQVDTVIIGGVVQPLVTHQTKLRDRYRKLPGAARK